MSGGVDSSVAAYLLKEAGYDVFGIFMRNWHEEESDGGACTAEEDYRDVRRVAAALDIPYYSVDFSKEYYDRVFRHFLSEYEKGRTPNPDVLCNREIKFDAFQEFSKKLGADKIATGHYCGVKTMDGRTYLTRAKDENKDQTYFLNQVSESQLKDVLFPLSEVEKPEVRAIAEKLGLTTASKKDSTGICFIGERDFRGFLKNYLPMRDGDIITLDGKKVGTHQGVFYYTVGQRKGFGLGGGGNGEPWYIVRKDVKNNILYVSQGEPPELYQNTLVTEKFHFITEPIPSGTRVTARIRHRQPLQTATAYFEPLGSDAEQRLRLEFDRPQRAVAAGQYAVLYLDDVCVGGGVIEG